MSSKAQMEFDCKARTAVARSVSGYTGNKGGGQALYTPRPNEKPHPVDTDSVEGRVFGRACAP